MTGQEFLKWVDQVGARHVADIVTLIGINRNMAGEWLALAKAGENVPVKRTVSLAMTATAKGLKPWAEGEGNGKGKD